MSRSDNVALVTGAGGDIGRAICLELLQFGMGVVGSDRSECELRQTKADAERFGAAADFFAVDLTDADGPERLLQQTLDAFGGLSLLVNCAGVCPTHPLSEATPDSWQRTLNLNTVIPALLSQRAAERMVDGSGAIVNVASISAFLPKLDQAEYGASKAALVSVTRSLAKALAPRGIRVNAVAPGIIDTELTHSIAFARSGVVGAVPAAVGDVPLSRMGLPEEVAKVVRFLASSDASYVTGQTLNVCGGLSMR